MGRRLRELAEFPFTKIQPRSFRMQIASAPPKRLTRILVGTLDVDELKQVAAVHVVRVYDHLGFVLCELPACSVAVVASLPSVASIWDDNFVGCPSPSAARPRFVGVGAAG